jgi:mono/diheme cytochrome c family protein
MSTLRLSIVLPLLSLLRFGQGVARAEAAPDTGSQVVQIFSAKCTACHGPNLPRPKGRFGYVLDLKRVRENPEMVIPSRPEESELWMLVSRGEMPPKDSPQGTLTLAQKETIKAWIAAGAPDASVSPVAPADGAEATSSPRQNAGALDRVVIWLGKFHLLLLHFPIALTVASGAGEAWSFWRRMPTSSEFVRINLWLGAVLAVPTAALGWFFAASGNGVG